MTTITLTNRMLLGKEIFVNGIWFFLLKNGNAVSLFKAVDAGMTYYFIFDNTTRQQIRIFQNKTSIKNAYKNFKEYEGNN